MTQAQANTAPRYAINPAAVQHAYWTPEVFQMVIGHRNHSYLNSLWLGTLWNLYILPYRAVREVLEQVFHFRFGVALLSVLVLPISVLWIFWFGLTGRLLAIPMSAQEAARAVILTPAQSREAIEAGHLTPLIDSHSL